MSSIHNYSLPSIEGKTINFADYKGKPILVVNVASECGYTPQYAQLQELYEHFKDKIVVVGVPCNDFGSQEPGNDSQISQFCTLRYGVTFPLTTKVGIKTDTHPLYQFLTQKALNGVQDSSVKWNFQKYVLNADGQLIGMFPSGTSPLDDAVLQALNV